jgi:N-glycosylase/DNA lyase
VWQIAQRDYKFGKGKHASLTKATYDAVGNKFRTMWGTEAGWAHSVLFTADLKAFSERLIAKSEVKIETVKTEILSKGVVKAEAISHSTKVTGKRVKVEPEEEDQVLEIKDKAVRETKRRRKM